MFFAQFQILLQKSYRRESPIQYTNLLPFTYRPVVRKPMNISVRFKFSDIIRADINKVMNARYNKGLSFTIKERQYLGINGLLPPGYRTFEEQLYSVKVNYDALNKPINKSLFLIALRNRHQRLYFRFISKFIEDVMPIVYTPTVGLICQHYGLVFTSPYGLFVTIHDRHHVFKVLGNWREKTVKAVCVTDGERILGLGDLGSNGMGIPFGKLQLYTALGRVNPWNLLPITLDVGTNNEALLADPFYIGLREKRIKGQQYEEFIDEFMESVIKRFGQRTLIHFEDFSTSNAFKLLDKYQHKYCVFNDDIQGTGAVGVAGILTAARATCKSIKDINYLFVGTGSASVGISRLLVRELIDQGLTEKEAYSKIYMYDVDGLLTKNRKNLQDMLWPFCKNHRPMKKLEECIAKIKPLMLIGATGAPGLFSESVLRKMAEINKKPVIFALSNPTSQAECTAEQAYQFTDGRVLFSGGSPFPPVIWKNKTYYPGQANNCLIFPGLAMGALCSMAYHIPDKAFLVAAHTVADLTNVTQIKKGSLYPPMSAATEVGFHIAVNVAQYIFDCGLSGLYPEPKSMYDFIKSKLYSYEYTSSIQQTWDYPTEVKN